jgi:hypothetical protein
MDRELAIDFSVNAVHHFRTASEQTRFDAAPVLSFLSKGFKITWFEEKRRRVWLAIVKPHPQVEKQFALNLEYIVIGHGFQEDFQQRTLLEQPSETIEYRVDPRIRFVASAAPLMKAACAAWAIQNSIAVVPLDSKEIQADAPDNEARLFQLLSGSLWRRDVFDDSEPVTDPSEFFGRELYVQEMLTRTLLGKPTSIFGLRKIGKTSLLRRVQSLLIADPRDLIVTAFVQGNATKYRRGRWWTLVFDIANEWSSVIEERAHKASSKVAPAARRLKAALESGTGAPQSAEVALAFERDFEKLQKAARQVARDSGLTRVRFVAIVDEIDELYPTARSAGFWMQDFFSLWNTLQTVRRDQASSGDLVFVLGGVNPTGVEAGTLLGRPNPLFEMGLSFLGPLPESEAAELLRGLGGRIGLNFREGAATAAHDITGGHPWLLRKLGSKIHDAYKNRSSQVEVGGSDVSRIYARTKRDFFAHVDWVLSHLQEVATDEYRLLKDVARDGSEAYLEDWREERFREAFAAHLEKYGLIEFRGNQPHIRIRLVSEVLAAPVASEFGEQKRIIREAADELEHAMRVRIATDLASEHTLEETVSEIVEAVPSEAANRPLGRQELRDLGVSAGVRALLESLNWGDYLLLLERHAASIRWAGEDVPNDLRLRSIREAVKTIHLARHNNDFELRQRIEQVGFDEVFRLIRSVREMLTS